jgi:hypothetical protein
MAERAGRAADDGLSPPNSYCEVERVHHALERARMQGMTTTRPRPRAVLIRGRVDRNDIGLRQPLPCRLPGRESGRATDPERHADGAEHRPTRLDIIVLEEPTATHRQTSRKLLDHRQ